MNRQLALHLKAPKKKKPWNKGKALHNFGNVKSHRRRVNPRRRRRKSGHRRANPTTVLLANPQRRRRRRVRRGAGAHVSHRTIRANPFRSRRRRGVRHLMRSARVHRRANPIGLNLRSAASIFRMALFGGAGIMLARVVGTFYSRNIAKHVLGDAANDSTSWRQIANEAVRLAFMAAATIAASRVLKAAGRVVAESDRHSFLAGGLAETGRQAFGVALQRLSPSIDRGHYGLDGPGQSDGMVDAQGNVWIERNGEYQLLEGVESAEAFAGVESAEAFAGGY